ncbi:MAG TPA: L-histidine N(alpha)-methyltransferase [Polyangiaceae bacterium]|jgi:dimethylhistidine N-methyltransferase|nr:L-histidine N(alpha)-methyltransferase [Polyangiaceae bacterium]
MTHASRFDALARADRSQAGTLGPDQETLSEIHRGLASTPKRLPCKLFYDALGSRLFEQITALPEYYPTRTELAILEAHAGEMASLIGADAVIVELGSGASRKTRLLLDALATPRAYIPVDISREMLLSSARALELSYPELAVRPVAGDYMHALDLPLAPEESTRGVTAYFPGSTIGNFEQDEAVLFLRRLRRACGEAARLLIGVDLPKERAVLEAAYDDAAGVTASFNRNVLRVLNRDYGGQFRLRDFRHRALYDTKLERVEMHLVSQLDQRILVGSGLYTFRAGEPIVTEHCYKYRPEAFRELAACAGFDVARVWTDARGWFSVQLLVPA